MDDNKIKVGDYFIVQRQGYTKLHKLKEKGTISLGPYTVILDNVVGHKLHEVFQMKVVNPNRKLYKIEMVTEVKTLSEVSVAKSGTDNRNITDDGSSQTLSKEEIEKLRDDNSTAKDMVEKLITNSKTFHSKTEFSQEKYMKKKEKKYYDYIKFRKPTVRLLAQMFYRQDPAKMLGIRVDDLSQILTYSNVQSDGDFILCDSGSSGMMTAALLNAIGRNTTGRLIHMHPGNEHQRTAVQAMGFPKEQLERCINVNLYSVLRCYYQNKDSYCAKADSTKDGFSKDECGKNECDKDEYGKNECGKDEDGQPGKRKRTNLDKDHPDKKQKTESGGLQDTDVKSSEASDDKASADKSSESVPKKPGWMFENEKACKILHEKVDGLILTVKEHPVNLVKELVPFLKGGRSLVVFSLIREPLQDLFVYLKSRCDVISIKVSNNFMREYQILPERTHPEVNMNSGGYILTAFKLWE